MMLEVVHQHEKLAPVPGIEFTPMISISGAGFWSVCQGRPKVSCEHKLWSALYRTDCKQNAASQAAVGSRLRHLLLRDTDLPLQHLQRGDSMSLIEEGV